MAGKVVLTGSLDFLGLGDIVQLIGSSGGTGVLQITSRYASCPGFIYFEKGNIINASGGSQTGLEAAYSLFGWTEGEFQFTREEVNIPKTITTNRMEIILDGLRMVDEGKVKKLGSASLDKEIGKGGIPIIKGPLIDYIYVAEEEEFAEGQKIVEENKHGSWMWAVLEGVVDIIKETPYGPLKIIQLGEGAFIGNMGTFSFRGYTRSSSVIATSKVQLGVLDIQRLSKEYANLSIKFRQFAEGIDKREKQVTDRVVEIYLKKDNSKKLLSGKKPFIKQGDKPNHLFIIEKGESVIVRKTPEGHHVVLAVLSRGDIIGSVPFIDIGHEPRSATVYVSEDFEAKEMDIAPLQQEYEQLMGIHKNLINHTANCVSITTRVACDFMKNLKKK